MRHGLWAEKDQLAPWGRRHLLRAPGHAGPGLRPPRVSSLQRHRGSDGTAVWHVRRTCCTTSGVHMRWRRGQPSMNVRGEAGARRTWSWRQTRGPRAGTGGGPEPAALRRVANQAGTRLDPQGSGKDGRGSGPARRDRGLRVGVFALLPRSRRAGGSHQRGPRWLIPRGHSGSLECSLLRGPPPPPPGGTGHESHSKRSSVGGPAPAEGRGRRGAGLSASLCGCRPGSGDEERSWVQVSGAGGPWRAGCGGDRRGPTPDPRLTWAEKRVRSSDVECPG